MKRYWPSALATGLLCVLPFVAEAQKKSEPAAPATEEEYKQLAKAKDGVVGKIGSAAGKSITLIVESQQIHFDPTKLNTAKPNYQPPRTQPNYNNIQAEYNRQRQYADLMRQMQEVARIQDVNRRAQRYREVMQAVQRMQAQAMQEQAREAMEAQRRLADQARRQLEQQAQAQKQAYKIETTSRSFEFNVKDEVVVRRMTLPFAYDDKGNVKQYTPEELQKLKGADPKLPGYAAKMEDLEGGQMAKLYFLPPKEGKIGEVDLVGNIIRPEVRAVVIYGDYDALNAPDKKN